MQSKEQIKEMLVWGCRVLGCRGRSNTPHFGLCWFHATLLPASLLRDVIAPGLTFEDRKALIDAAAIDLRLKAVRCDAESLRPGRAYIALSGSPT